MARSLNKYSEELMHRYPGKVIALGSVLPGEEGAEDILELLSRARARGKDAIPGRWISPERRAGQALEGPSKSGSVGKNVNLVKMTLILYSGS